MRTVKRSLKLNMKKDDARTLMLKMDARLTYAGRERYASFQQEAERELKHIEVTQQLMNAERNRARMDVQRRFDFYQELKEHNRERRRNRGIAWCKEEERDWEREAVRAARRRKTLPKIEVRKNHEADAVGSIRRGQKKELASKMTHEKRINRSLNALNESYAIHKALAEQNEEVLGQMIADADCDETNTGGSGDDLLPFRKTTKPTQISKAELPLPTRKTCLPKLKTDKMSAKVPETNRLSVAIPTKLTTKSFPVTASTNNGQGTPDPKQDRAKSLTSSQMQREGVRSTAELHGGAFGRPTCSYWQIPRPSLSPKPPERKICLPVPPMQSIPNKFYEMEDNLFSKGDVLPSISRSSDLLNADKADRMYEWLGFESQQQFKNLRAAAVATEYCEDDDVLLENYNTDLPNGEPDTSSAALNRLTKL